MLAEAEAEAEDLEDWDGVEVCCLKEKRILQMASLREIPPGPWIVSCKQHVSVTKYFLSSF